VIVASARSSAHGQLTDARVVLGPCGRDPEWAPRSRQVNQRAHAIDGVIDGRSACTRSLPHRMRATCHSGCVWLRHHVALETLFTGNRPPCA
jgi:hypothetical protein